MAIDNSVYGMLQAPDIIGGFQRGVSIAGSINDQKRKDQEAQMEQQKMQMAKQAKDADIISRVAGNIKDQGSYDQGLMFLSKNGVDVSKLSPTYNPQEVDFYHKSALSALEQINQGNKEREFSYGKEKDEKQFSYNEKKDNRDYGLAQNRFALDKTDKNRDYEIKLANMGLSKEQFEESKNQNAVKNSLAERELEMIKNDKTLSQTAKQKFLDAKLAEIQKKSNGKTPEMSVAEAKQIGLYKLGMEAENQFKNAVADKNNYDPTQVGQVIDNSDWAPNWLRNDKAVESRASQANWVEAFLRDASGAAIPPSERMAYAKDFFPQPGDTEQVVTNKERLRQQKMENARIAAGGDSASPSLAQQPSFDPDVVAYAQKHGISPEQANMVKQQRMSQVGSK